MTVSHATIVFTDLVGSTALRSRLGEEAADELRRVHDRLLTEAVEGHSGMVVKGLGDGLLARFGSTVDAVSAAVAIQQAADAHGRRHQMQRFEVKVGISAGDVSVEGGDLFGSAVIEAARLCDVAVGGQILAAELVDLLTRGRGEHRFTAHGQIELKGLPAPVGVVEVDWSPRDAAPDAPPLPAALSTAKALPFVGRADVCGQLCGLWDQTAAGGSATVLLAGEPGAGKTRLTAELARRAQAGGARVLYGHCQESLDTAFVPVVEALRGVVESAPECAPSELLGPSAGRLARLLPGLSEREPELVIERPDDAESDRYQMFTAVVDALSHVRTGTGVLLVLDDLQWADRATSQWLRFLARRGVPAGVLVAGTYRDTDLDPHEPFGQVVGELRREQDVICVPLAGLDRDGLRELLDAVFGQDTPAAKERDRLVELLADQTEGNPFFVSELLQHLIGTGGLSMSEGTWHLTRAPDDVGVPEGVRDLVGRRTAVLGDDVVATLATAAVIGPVFDIDVLAAITEVDDDVLLDQLDAAVGGYVIDEEAIGRFRFAHALFRSSLYESLSATRRARLHRRVAAHLEAARSPDVAALAQHYAQAAATSPDAAGKAMEYTVRAGEAAMASDAPDAAIDAFARALRLADDVDHHDPVWRARTMVRLAVAERLAGHGDYRGRLEDAAEVALELGGIQLAAEALLSDRGLQVVQGDVSPRRRHLQEQVLAGSGALSSPVVAQVLSQWAGDMMLTDDVQRRERALDRAWAAVRDLSARDEPNVVAACLCNLLPLAYADRRDGDLHELMHERLVEAAEGATGRAQLLAHFRLVGSSLWFGRVDAAAEHAERAAHAAERLHEPIARSLPPLARVEVEFALGDLAVAAAVLNDYEQIVRQADESDAGLLVLVLRQWLNEHAGRAGELAEQLRLLLDVTDSTAVHAGTARALVCAGYHDEAAAILDRLAERDFGTAVPDPHTTATLGQLAVVASALRSPHRRRILNHLDAVEAPLCLALSIPFGPPEHYAGLLCRSLDDLEGAIDRFRTAAEHMSNIGARGYLAQAHAQLAAALEARGRPGDVDEAGELAASACATASELGTGDVLDVCAHLAPWTPSP